MIIQDRCIFQSTLPRRERLQQGCGTLRTWGFQSTLPRRERPAIVLFVISFNGFQSTLPRRERPGYKGSAIAGDPISIHAPAKGATKSVTAYNRYVKFQSTLPRRERHMYCATWVSTWSFQSTLPRRERHRGDAVFTTTQTFQSTLPRRERLLVFTQFLYHLDFNPRSREGSDLGVWCDFEYDTEISIHAPAKGATAFINIFSLAVRLFFISSHQ